MMMLLSRTIKQCRTTGHEKTGILPKFARKRTTDKNLESATRGVARVGQRENAILLSHYLLQLKRLRLPPPAKNQTTIV